MRDEDSTHASPVRIVRYRLRRCGALFRLCHRPKKHPECRSSSDGSGRGRDQTRRDSDTGNSRRRAATRSSRTGAGAFKRSFTGGRRYARPCTFHSPRHH